MKKAKTEVPVTMKAVLVTQPGGPEQLYIGEAPVPILHPCELLIQVKATAVNRADTLQRKGSYNPPPGTSHIIGLEATGLVVGLGSACTLGFKVGDKVMCLLSGGGYAEFVAVHEGSVMPIPAHLTFEQAAAIPEAFLTAFQLLYTIGQVSKDDVVLVHAGASGVGTAAIQLARLAGAMVLATVGSQDKIEYCTRLGAKAFNYKTCAFDGPVNAYVKDELKQPGVTLILDCIGASYAEMNLRVAATDARWVLFGTMGGAIADKFPLSSILHKRITLTGTTLRSRSLAYKANLVRHFSQVAIPAFGEGPLKVYVDKVFPLNQISDAHRYMEDDKTLGKIVISLSSAL